MIRDLSSPVHSFLYKFPVITEADGSSPSSQKLLNPILNPQSNMDLHRHVI